MAGRDLKHVQCLNLFMSLEIDCLAVNLHCLTDNIVILIFKLFACNLKEIHTLTQQRFSESSKVIVKIFRIFKKMFIKKSVHFNFPFIKESWKKCIMVPQAAKLFSTLIIIMFLEHQISILEWFLKDRVLKIQLCHHRNKCNFKTY